MALNLPEEMDRELDRIAAEEHVSKDVLLQQGAQLVIDRHTRRREIEESLEFVMTHDAELLKRLEDA
ncbi:hypothetical protein D477_011576 [Arthrobacter crystallopoietes BAB-32]|uniref:Ribbon-helix-helix protein CopG domain-containing protein n=1 Tax=Arthrobacter crystallopoietes BAB-32 TaxID=1246476 RepID=N1UUF5_9MICC|nr:hypothetical protein [Arthrobacter crystallopoietes]EMY34056.1 hypothetical protein D477_011576 [Arthrobacter crystallopoietes BAB-32]